MNIRKGLWLLAGLVVIAVVSALSLSISNNCCGNDLSDDQLRNFRKQAALGDTKAMMELFFYYDGHDDPAEAEEWLKRADEKGDSEAAMFLYDKYISKSDPAQRALAIRYLIRAAERGSPAAQQVLGRSFKEGSAGLPKNMERAKYWLRRSALGGDADGVLELCTLALAERNHPQCVECLELISQAMKSVQADSYLGMQLDRLRERILSEHQEPMRDRK